ncbi:ComF family protein [Candidatus Entotheonella palauensis]|uniref:ComF family protein n=1 Tax=Candidatus Entotheonella palauensis TaxID=93172 RepID=UPI0015C47053|nr:ComF family protein [Candidatus Entotheonella palauensis]
MRTWLDFILPPFCCVCEASTTGAPIPWVCRTCWDNIPYIKPPLCHQCGAPFAAPPEGIASPLHRCETCLSHPPAFAQARAVGLYHGTLQHIIHVMKYRSVYGLNRPLAQLLHHQFAACWTPISIDVLVPVPLHRRRLWQREFDQALALARHLSQAVQIPCEAEALIRQRYTQSQVGLNLMERDQNVRGAFAVQRPQAIRGKAVLLIDDVYTTGATVKECTRVLRRAGAEWVGVYTLARVGAGAPH